MTALTMASPALAGTSGSVRWLEERIIASLVSIGSRLAIQPEDSRRETIRADIARRLRKACSYLSDAEFAALVEKIVKTQIGGERGSR